MEEVPHHDKKCLKDDGPPPQNQNGCKHKQIWKEDFTRTEPMKWLVTNAFFICSYKLVIFKILALESQIPPTSLGLIA